jgi:hypothetical protein
MMNDTDRLSNDAVHPDSPRPRCDWGGCDRPAVSRGYCPAHAAEATRMGLLFDDLVR